MANAVQRRPTRRSGPRPAPLRVAIVGLGMGRQHIPRYREDPACEVVALCDVDTARLEAAAREFAIPRTFTDAGELFASGLADVVSIPHPTPPTRR